MNDPFSIVVCRPSTDEPLDPAPAETHKRDVDLVPAWDANTKGVVGWSTGGWAALKLAAVQPELPRLVLVSLPYPEDDEWPADLDIDLITSKTLLLFGSADPLTGSSHGTKWQKRLASARLEMVPGAGRDIIEQMWPRVLSFLAPRRTRKD